MERQERLTRFGTLPTSAQITKFEFWQTCYDLSPKQGRFAGNVCQNLSLAVWANVQNVQTHWERQERWQRSRRVRRS